LGKHKKVLFAVVATYLVMSFVPQIGAMNLLGKGGSAKGASSKQGQ
jgi:hypothetical protein